MKNIEVKYIAHDGVDFNVIPMRQTEGSAGFDLTAAICGSISIEPGCSAVIPSGIAVHIDDSGYFGLIAARSGLSIKHGITLKNGVGIIDSDYTGEISVALINVSAVSYTVNPGDRIAQLIFVPAALPALEIVADFTQTTERGSSGFGSTGKK